MPNNDDLLAMSAQVLDTLLRDHTTGKHIFWATHDYEALGPEYDYHSEIRPELIDGERGMVVQPRVLKSRANQTDRSKDMAEVFTPSWICNAQNNLVDDAMLSCDTEHTEKTAHTEDGPDWQDYVRTTILEITCGEAPYLVSRYDTTTGDPIPLEKRIGLLDRKLRLVSENTQTGEEWLRWAEVSYQNTYGYEWQGDNLLLARQNLLFSFMEYYEAKFSSVPPAKSIHAIADIVAWNLWQMDGLTGGLPDREVLEDRNPSFFLPPVENRFCRIFDWEKKTEIRFIDLLNGKS